MTLAWADPEGGQWYPAIRGSVTWKVTGNDSKVSWSSQDERFQITSNGTSATITNNGTPGMGDITASCNGKKITATIFAGVLFAYNSTNSDPNAADSQHWSPVHPPGWLPQQSKMDGYGMFQGNHGHPAYALNPQDILPLPSSSGFTYYSVESAKGNYTDDKLPDVYTYPPKGMFLPCGQVLYFPQNAWRSAQPTSKIPSEQDMRRHSASVAYAPEAGGSSDPDAGGRYARVPDVNVACYVLDLTTILISNSPTYMRVSKKD